jgi:hypothetical protein
MFTLQIVDTDAFLDMPATSQLLYFHLAMRADDDGFVDKPKKIMREVGVNDDDMKVLLTKRFILAFESGIIVIKHWKMHNYIQSDRYHETKYFEEKGKLRVKENGAYTECIQDVSKMETEVRLGKVRLELGKDSVAAKAAEKSKFQQIINYFFELKGWADKDKGFYEKNKIIYGRFTRPAKDLLGLCDDDLEEAKLCVKKVSDWAESRDLDWSIETVFKKWYDLDQLKPKEKKPYYKGNRVFEICGKKFVLMPNGEKLQFAGSEKEIIYK